jgi:hypothetical protein
MTTTDEARTAVLGAHGPADVFGPRARGPAADRAARRTYRQYAFLLHPDRAGDPAAFLRLEALYRDWSAATVRTATDRPAPVVIGRLDAYPVGDLLAQGSVATVYHGSDAVLKVARRPATNRFLDNERSAYRALARMTTANEWLRAYYPRLRDVGGIAGSDGQVRQVNVLTAHIDGFVTLADVRRAYPQGMDGRDWAWMYRRLLCAVAGAHLAGLVHGAIVADNVLIHPGQHGVVLAGWSFAIPPGSRLPGLIGSGSYPPEVAAGRPVTDKADIHQLHTLMLDLLDPGERAQIAYARGCRQDNPRMRPSAAALLTEYDELIGRLYGRRRFRPFTIATPAV